VFALPLLAAAVDPCYPGLRAPGGVGPCGGPSVGAASFGFRHGGRSCSNVPSPRSARGRSPRSRRQLWVCARPLCLGGSCPTFAAFDTYAGPRLDGSGRKARHLRGRSSRRCASGRSAGPVDGHCRPWHASTGDHRAAL